MTLSLSGDIAATITAVGTLVTVIGNLVLQILQSRRSKENGRKIDENTKMTADIHAATQAIAESTGTHKTLEGP